MDSDIDISNAKLMWAPDTNRSTKMDAFRETVNRKFGLKLGNYQELYKWSVNNYAEFWEECLQFLPIRYSKPWQQVVDKSKSIEEVPEWFQGCHMNFAENMLQYNDDRIAVYAAVEGREQVKKITHRELRDRVALYASAMKKMGIKKNDRIVGYISNCVEALEAMLAASSLGAIWSSTSPDFGVSGVLDRFTQIQPKLIFSVDCVVYNGRVHNHLEKLQHVVQGLPDLEKVVVISGLTHGDNKPDISSILNSCHLEDFLNQDGTVPELEFEQLPFSHPLYIMYSSGTTGAPKCMVHSAGGTLLQQLKEHVIHGNLTRDDVIMYYTTTGWMMWNWLVAALAGGASIVLYDGSPLVPSANVLWDLVDKIGISILGTGAKWLAVLEDKGVKPIETHSLKSLHTILSTGSPLKPLTYEYVYRDIKKDLLLGSITGGTDIISCFAGQNCTLPVYRGEIQARNLGMAVECWNEDGKPVFGESGELVCTKPFPSMPTYFWNDEDGLKYKKAYFDKFKGVWSHGDFCLINKSTYGIWMLGRSDGTLNPNGVRFGSAELYHVVETFKEIQDSLCIAQRKKDLSEERVILFLKMAPGSQFTEDLVSRVKKDIRSQLSARHVPAVILETQDIPYTQSGKKVEVAVRKVISGEKITNRGAFINPQSLDLYMNIPELQHY